MIKKEIYNKINITIIEFLCINKVGFNKLGLDVLKFYIKKFVSKTAEDTDVSFLPPMARRKLSALDKTALCVMEECLKSCEHDKQNIKIVFASQYGELDRLKKLVAQYSQENEVSPATFSASVHNSAVGQFSLLKKITKSYNSVSAEEDTFSAGLTEAVITAKDCDVLYCYCDAVTPEKAVGFACIISTCGQTNAKLKDNKLYYISQGVEKCIF